MVDISDLEVKNSEPQLKGKPFQLDSYVKFKKKRQAPGILSFCFFKMADSCCPSWIAKFKLPPN